MSDFQEVNAYLKRSAFTSKLIQDKVSSDLKIIVVIPSFNEENIIATLQSLKDCHPINGSVEIIISINQGELASDEITQVNEKCLEDCIQFQQENSSDWISFYPIFTKDLPKKHAGVGLGRKIGMDEAVRRFEEIQEDGVIVCFDADSLCTSNYLVEIQKAFFSNKILTACIRFEHPLEGEMDKELYEAITSYELFLRYYNQALKYAGFPYHFHTIGSSMAVRNSIYQKQGGMNKRKAGEDFYFLQKLFPLGGVIEINDCMVIPSPRKSDRVPFGTGKAVNDIIDENRKDYPTYPFEMFKEIRLLIDKAFELYQLEKSQIGVWLMDLHPDIRSFLLENEFVDSMLESNRQSPNMNRFMYRFFEYLNAFKILKLVHYMRDHSFGSSDLLRNSNELLGAMSMDNSFNNYQDLLIKFRKMDYEV